ncbi:hypothetical protein P8452_08096 [Trifolium repens]|nr:hypothetical protein P8452_08096 [Trifolium repens]
MMVREITMTRQGDLIDKAISVLVSLPLTLTRTKPPPLLQISLFRVSDSPQPLQFQIFQVFKGPHQRRHHLHIQLLLFFSSSSSSVPTLVSYHLGGLYYSYCLRRYFLARGCGCKRLT